MLFFCKRNGPDDYLEIGNKKFFSQLKELEEKEILLYIHGYSNLPEQDIFPRTKTLQSMFNSKENGLVKVVPIIWPCDNDIGAIKDYWDDQKAADASNSAFSRVLQMFMKWQDDEDNRKNPCMKRINVLAHSMGNRVLRETIKAWAKYDMNYRLPIIFRNSFLVAADIVNETLEIGKDGDLISQSSRNVTVYYSSDDLALRASKITNLKNKIASKRLGHTGPANMDKVAKNVYAMDCDDVNTKYDFPAGHSYFLDNKKESVKGGSLVPGVVFNHMYNSIKTGRVKSKPFASKTMILDEAE